MIEIYKMREHYNYDYDETEYYLGSEVVGYIPFENVKKIKLDTYYGKQLVIAYTDGTTETFAEGDQAVLYHTSFMKQIKDIKERKDNEGKLLIQDKFSFTKGSILMAYREGNFKINVVLKINGSIVTIPYDDKDEQIEDFDTIQAFI